MGEIIWIPSDKEQTAQRQNMVSTVPNGWQSSYSLYISLFNLILSKNAVFRSFIWTDKLMKSTIKRKKKSLSKNHKNPHNFILYLLLFCMSEQSKGVRSVEKTTVWIKHLEYEKRPFSLKRIGLHNTYFPLGWYLIASWMTATFVPASLPTTPFKLCIIVGVNEACFICSEIVFP